MRENSQLRFAAEDFRRRLRAGEDITGHHHDRNQLVYPASGLLAVTTDQGTWIAPPHRAVWVPAFATHEHRAWGDTDMRGVLFRQAARSPFATPTVIAVSPLLRELLLVLTDGRQRGHDARVRLEDVALDQMAEADEAPLHLPEARDARLAAVLALLRANPADNSAVAQFGRQVGASERTLSRLFRAELGMTFPQWRARLRVHRALVLLAEGHSVTRAATDTGWSDASSFIESFTRIVGVTPGHYAAEVRHARTGERSQP